MGKKLTHTPTKSTKLVAALSSLALAAGSGLMTAPPVSAVTTVDGVDYFDAEEIMGAFSVFGHELDICRDTGISDEVTCRNSILDSHIASDGDVFRALDSFMQKRFLITSINPGLSTLELFYNDYDWTSVRTENINNYPEILRLLTVTWPGAKDTYTLANSNSIAGNIAYLSLEKYNDPLPTDDNAALYISLTTYDPRGIRTTFSLDNLAFNYGDCLSMDGYYEGNDCRIRYSVNGDYFYVPDNKFLPAREDPQDNSNNNSQDNSNNSQDNNDSQDSSNNGSQDSSNDNTQNNSGSDSQDNNPSNNSTNSDSSGNNSPEGTNSGSTNPTPGNTNTNTDTSYNTESTTGNDSGDSDASSAESTAKQPVTQDDSVISGTLTTKVLTPNTGANTSGGEEPNGQIAINIVQWLLAILAAVSAFVLRLLLPTKRQKKTK